MTALQHIWTISDAQIEFQNLNINMFMISYMYMYVYVSSFLNCQNLSQTCKIFDKIALESFYTFYESESLLTNFSLFLFNMFSS